MEITINGKKYRYKEAVTVYELLNNLGKQRLPLALRINGETIPRKYFKRRLIKDKDRISLIVFLGGG